MKDLFIDELISEKLYAVYKFGKKSNKNIEKLIYLVSCILIEKEKDNILSPALFILNSEDLVGLFGTIITSYEFQNEKHFKKQKENINSYRKQKASKGLKLCDIEDSYARIKPLKYLKISYEVAFFIEQKIEKNISSICDLFKLICIYDRNEEYNAKEFDQVAYITFLSIKKHIDKTNENYISAIKKNNSKSS